MKWDRNKVLEETIILSKKLKRRPTKRDSSNLYVLSKKYFGSWKNLIKETGYDFKERQEVKLPKVNSNKFYYFLGLLSTDGHIQFVNKGGKYRVIIFTSNISEKNMIISLIKDLFGYNASVRSKIYGFSKKPNYEIYISSKKLCELFKDIGIPSGAKSLIIEVPKIVKNSSPTLFWSFIRGIFDGDGSILNTKRSKTFKIFSGSEKFIKEIGKLFYKKEFSPRIYKEKENLWSLRINKKEEIKRIYNLLYKNPQYFYERKKKKWEEQYI
jgi:DNA-binding transcriptional regulator WhiA